MSDVTWFGAREPIAEPPKHYEYPGSNSGSNSGRGGQTYIYYPGGGAPLQHQVCRKTYPLASFTKATCLGYSTGIYFHTPIASCLVDDCLFQQPGHSVVIQNGQVTQVPGSVVSA